MFKKLLCIALLPFTLTVGFVSADDHAQNADKESRVQEMYDKLPAKYKVPGLVPVDRIIDFNINGWSVIDDRSLIVDASVSKRYLFVLQTRSPDLNFAQAVAFDNGPGNYIRAGFDRIFIGGDMMRMPYYIQAIFVLDGREGASAAKDYIKNYKDDAPKDEEKSSD